MVWNYLKSEKSILTLGVLCLAFALFANYNILPRAEDKPFGFGPDGMRYLWNTQMLVGEKEGHQFVKAFRPLYSLASTIPYRLMRMPQAMLVLPLLSALAVLHFLDKMMIESGFKWEERVMAALLLLFSRVFTNSATYALTEMLMLALGFWFLWAWWRGERGWKLMVIFLLALAANTLSVAFFLAAAFSDWMRKKRLNWTRPFLAILLLGLPLIGYVYYEAYVLYASAGGAVFSNILERLISFPRILFMATGPLFIFGVLGMYELVSKKRPKALDSALLGVVLANALFVLSWACSDTRFWTIPMPSFAFFSVKWMEKLEREEKWFVTVSSIIFFKYYSFLADILSHLF